MSRISELFRETLTTLGEGIVRLVDRNIVLAGIFLFVANLITNVGVSVFSRYQAVSSSQLDRFVEGSIDTSMAFPLAITDSLPLAALIGLIGLVLYSVSLIILVRILLDEEGPSFGDYLERLVYPTVNGSIGILGIFIGAVGGLAIASVPMEVIRNIFGSFAVGVSLVVFFVVLLFFLGSSMLFLPALIEQEIGVRQAFREAFHLSNGNRLYLATVLVVVFALSFGFNQISGGLVTAFENVNRFVSPILGNMSTTINAIFLWSMIVAAYEHVIQHG